MGHILRRLNLEAPHKPLPTYSTPLGYKADTYAFFSQMDAGFSHLSYFLCSKIDSFMQGYIHIGIIGTPGIPIPTVNNDMFGL